MGLSLAQIAADRRRRKFRVSWSPAKFCQTGADQCMREFLLLLLWGERGQASWERVRTCVKQHGSKSQARRRRWQKDGVEDYYTFTTFNYGGAAGSHVQGSRVGDPRACAGRIAPLPSMHALVPHSLP